MFGSMGGEAKIKLHKMCKNEEDYCIWCLVMGVTLNDFKEAQESCA
jgi:hypothetical protein